ncbi:MAG: zinc-dependent peptidase, partial [Gemmatimonadota bacterium]|nr:zinc-dependent peptidase [Gemmatimonadota bacterium]
MFGFLKRRRRRALRARPVPPEWRVIVARNVPAFGRQTAEVQAAWFGHAHVLLEEKHWEGCGGLELTDEIRVTIAMHAARLLLGLDADYFPNVLSILVYPTTLLRREEQQVADGIWTEDDDELDGLAATDLGAIVISWDAVLDGIDDPGDGFNVVLHECAHELDFQDGDFNGAPLMES